MERLSVQVSDCVRKNERAIIFSKIHFYPIISLDYTLIRFCCRFCTTCSLFFFLSDSFFSLILTHFLCIPHCTFILIWHLYHFIFHACHAISHSLHLFPHFFISLVFKSSSSSSLLNSSHCTLFFLPPFLPPIFLRSSRLPSFSPPYYSPLTFFYSSLDKINLCSSRSLL